MNPQSGIPQAKKEKKKSHVSCFGHGHGHGVAEGETGVGRKSGV